MSLACCDLIITISDIFGNNKVVPTNGAKLLGQFSVGDCNSYKKIGKEKEFARVAQRKIILMLKLVIANKQIRTKGEVQLEQED